MSEESEITDLAQEPVATVPPPSPEPADAVEQFYPSLETQMHQHLDAWWADVVTNLGGRIPTDIHNQLHDLKETLRLRLVGLFHKEIQ